MILETLFTSIDLQALEFDARQLVGNQEALPEANAHPQRVFGSRDPRNGS